MKIVPRSEINPTQWNHFVDIHASGFWWHRTEWLSYELARPGHVDHSFGIALESGRLIAVVPLIEQEDEIQASHEPIALPLVESEADRATVLHHLLLTLHEEGVERARFRTCPLAEPSECFAVDNVGIQEIDTTSWPTFILDLSLDRDVLWKGIRKSYQNLIHQGEKQYIVREDGFISQQTLTKDDLIETARQLHHEVSQRETRPESTWWMMRDWMTAGHGYLLVGFERPTYVIQGYAYAITYKRKAYFASGATRVKNLAHLLQWEMIQRLKAQGITHYEIGWGVRKDDTKKQQDISFFKSGFGGTQAQVEALEWVL